MEITRVHLLIQPMKLIGQIFSNIQTDINDISGERIQLAEYVDYAQRVADDLALRLKVWISYGSYVPNPSVSPVLPSPNSVLIPASAKCIQLLRVTRNGQPTREYSRQAVQDQAMGTYPFTTNDTELTAYNFTSFVNQDESMTLTFTTAFEADEIVYTEMLTGRPYNFVTWSQATSIPDFLVDVMEYGIKMRVFERLYNSGLDKMQPRMQYAQQMFTKYLGEAKGYTKNFHDERSVIQRQALKWLSDGKTIERLY